MFIPRSDKTAMTALGHQVSQWPRFSRNSFAVFLTGAAVRLICFIFSSNNGGDALSRVTGTAMWLQHKDWHLDAFGPYLPLHFWLMALPSWLLGDVQLGARLLSLVLGVCSLYLIWLATERLFDTTAADYSMLLYAFYTLHVGYSTTSSSEAPFIFFLLCWLSSLFHYRRTGRTPFLVLSGLALTGAGAIRYEAWVLILGTVLALLWPLTRVFRRPFWRIKTLTPLLGFAAAAGIWPIVFMGYCWSKFEDPVHYLTEQQLWTAEIGAFANHSFLYISIFHPGVILITLSPLGIAAILYGIWEARDKGAAVRDYFIIMTAFAGVQFYDLVSGGTWPSARYTMTLATLLAVAGGYGVSRFLSHFSARRGTAISTVFVGALIINFSVVVLLSENNWRFTDKVRSVSPLMQFPLRVEQVSEYLKPRMNSDRSIIIDNYNCESGIIARAIDLPLPPGKRAFLASSRIHNHQCDSFGSFSAEAIAAESKDLMDFIKLERPQYVVYYTEGSLRPYLPLGGSPRVTLAGVEFQCVYKGLIYQVYSVTY